MNVYLKGAIAALLVAGLIYTWYRVNESKLPANQSPAEFKTLSQMESEGVPDFELERMDGTKLRLSDLKGKLLIVNFWASWCDPCVEEFPSMVRLAEKMKGDLVIVAVSTDEQRADIEPFLKAFSVPDEGFEVVWDSEHKVMEMYGVKKIPESFIVGTDFRLARKIVGIENWDSDNAIAFFRALKAGLAR